MLITFGRKFMTLRLELSAFIGELFHLQSVHQKSHLEVMAIEEIHDSPDADAVAVFSLGHERHILLKNSLWWRNSSAALALKRFVRGKVLRPNLPRHNESHTDLGFVWPFYRSWSTHDFSLL